MLTHLFKLIWNKKKQNFLIMLELFLSFLVMFAVFTLIINYYQSYKQPVGFEYKNIWAINRTTDQGGAQATMSGDSAVVLDGLIKQQIKSMPGIEEVSYSSVNTPYSSSKSVASLNYDKVEVKSAIYTVEDSYADLLDMKMLSGRWFAKDDDGANYTPGVINIKLKEELFGEKDPLNQLLSLGDKNYRIVGIVNNVKNTGDYYDPGNGFYVRADSSFYGNNNPILVRVKEGADALLEANLFRSLSGLMKNSSIEIVHLDESRKLTNKLSLLPVIIILTVVIFFIVNVALGLFGVLWFNINKRKGEIGLRRAIGASGNDISKQMVGEALTLTTLSVLIGSFFAIQFPLLNILDLAASTYLVALVFAIVFIYLFVALCALYPAKQAAAIYPAIALHEE